MGTALGVSRARPPGGFSIPGQTETKHFVCCVLKSKESLVFASLPFNARHLHGLVIKLEQADAAQFPYYRADQSKGEMSIHLGKNSNLIGKDPGTAEARRDADCFADGDS